MTAPDTAIAIALTGLLFSLGVAATALPFLQWLRADESGIWWRGSFASWKEIIDFYEIPAPKNQNVTRKPTLVIERRDGLTRQARGDWENRDALRAIVAERANAAKVREWGLKGARPEDSWPRAFDYRPQPSRWPVAPEVAFAALCGLTLLIFTGMSAWRYGREMGWLWGVARFLAGGSAAGAMPALLLWLAHRAQSDAKQRREQKIILARDGFVFTDPERRIAGTWHDITDYFYTTR